MRVQASRRKLRVTGMGAPRGKYTGKKAPGSVAGTWGDKSLVSPTNCSAARVTYQMPTPGERAPEEVIGILMVPTI